jgi:hypothetical protein
LAAATSLPQLPSSTDPRVRKLNPTEVNKLLDAAKTPRVRELETYQAYFEGTAYAGRPHFFNDDVPLQERAPNVIYRLPSIAAESNVAFAMGEGRFPTVLALSSENDDVFDKALGLNKDDSAILDSFSTKLIDLARLEQVFRNAYRMAQASRSVAIVLGFRGGLPFADLVWSKMCSPTFGDPIDPYRCTKLEIRYRYTQQWRDRLITNGEWWTRVFEYLRVIDVSADTVYQPVAIWDDTDAGAVEGASPIQATTAHGFGFCPVHWYARNRESIVGGSPDGKAIHDGLCPMVEQLDLSISQKHRAAIYAGDPVTCITGVSAEEDIGDSGTLPRPNPMPGDLTKEGKQWGKAFYGSQGQGGSALRRGVGSVWRIESPDGKVFMLALDADALKALDDDGKDLARMLCDDMGVVIVDLSVFAGSGEISGRTLAFIFSKQINKVSQDREDVGRCCILPVLNMFYRMLLARSDGVYLPGLPKVLPILGRFYKSVGGLDRVWFCPQQKLKWGAYFEPSDTDEQTQVGTAINAFNGKIITLKTAVEHVKGVFQIGSTDQYVDELAKEAAQRQQDAMDNAAAQAALLPTPSTNGPVSGPNQGPPAAPPRGRPPTQPKAAAA